MKLYKKAKQNTLKNIMLEMFKGGPRSFNIFIRSSFLLVIVILALLRGKHTMQQAHRIYIYIKNGDTFRV